MKKSKKNINPNKEEFDCRRGAVNQTITALFLTSGILLFPSLSRHPLFAKGDLLFPKTMGIIFLCTALLLGLYRLTAMYVSPRMVGSRVVRIVFFIASTIGGTLFLLGITAGVWIRYEVRRECAQAMRTYKERGCVGALMRTVEDTNNNYHTRNNAIWALGQLGDPRALPILRKQYTGSVPDREPLDRTISQYELQKAIRLAEGGLNIPALFWRHGPTR